MYFQLLLNYLFLLKEEFILLWVSTKEITSLERISLINSYDQVLEALELDSAGAEPEILTKGIRENPAMSNVIFEELQNI